MSMNFANAAKNENNFSETTNGAVAYKNTGSALVNLFSVIGSLRKASLVEIINLFVLAFQEDALMAMKMVFYARNVRGGLGERDTSRKILAHLANAHPEIVRKNMALIPHFGRFDDLYCLVGSPVEEDMWRFMRMTLNEDISNMAKGKPISLLTKWMKSVNASSKETVRLGKMTAKAMGKNEMEYRHMLSRFRAYLKVPEHVMSAGHWSELDYETIPSIAMKNYRKAFGKHDYERFTQYIQSLEKGEAKINSATLFPYDIMVAGHLRENYHDFFDFDKDAILEAQWKALPNYVVGGNNIVVMADTSGSMQGLPLATSIGLSVYFAERNQGAYHNLFMTFSKVPSIVELPEVGSLADKIKKIPAIVENTDLEAGFDLILKIALENKVSQEDMPKALLVITDMQFDSTQVKPYKKEVFLETMKRKFEAKGYTMPKIIFWNVEGATNTQQAKAFDQDVILVSGHSASTFRDLIANIGKSPFDFMQETLANPMYDVVQI